MAGDDKAPIPKSPETQSSDVREQLEQTGVSHDGEAREAGETQPGGSGHRGAVETEVTPIMPPVRGPTDLVGDAPTGGNLIDPGDEITPG